MAQLREDGLSNQLNGKYQVNRITGEYISIQPNIFRKARPSLTLRSTSSNEDPSLVQLFRISITRRRRAGPVEESQRDIDPMLEHAGSGVARGRSSLVVGKMGGSVVLRSLDRPLGRGALNGCKGKLGSVVSLGTRSRRCRW